MENARVPTSEQLLAEMGWVRQLARALIKDAALADDVAQDTWIVAAEREPDTSQPLRPWLARVVKNLVHTGRRSRARRGERDAAFVDERTARTPAELVEHVELQRAVADEVLALAEPYRSTVLLHFVDGHSSAEIARRLGIPDGTVRRRLKVAIDQLREALAKRTDQPQRGWLAALVPFAMAKSSTSAQIGAIAMKKLIAVAVLLVLLLALGVGVIVHRRRSHDPSTSGASSNTAQHRGSGADESASTQPTTIPEWIPQAGAPARRVAGRVVFRGAPVGGARVKLGIQGSGEVGPFLGLSADDFPGIGILQVVAEVKSASDGTFDFGVQPPTTFTVSAAADNYSTGAIVLDNANPKSKSDQLVIALGACTMRLSGTVADASGGGIAKATILVNSVEGTESDANGHFRVCMSPRDNLGPAYVEVRIEADGYGTTHEIVLAMGDLQHDFYLVPEAILVGHVLTNSGDPVAGARVVALAEPQEIRHHVASGFAYTDSDGRFRIARLAPGAFQLFAQAKGVSTTPLAVFAQPTTTSRDIRLVLDRKPLARVRGHVYKANAPVGGAQIQAVLDDRPAGACMSQADGSFVFDAMSYGKARFFVAPNIAEAAAEITIDRAEVDDVRVDLEKTARIHGHVTRKGAPVAGASIVFMPPPQASFFGPQPSTKTDASGTFALELPVGMGQLSAWDNSKKAFAVRSFELAPEEDKVMDVELDTSGEVIGTVVNEAGGPVAGVYMRLDIADGSGDMCESMTDAKGQFDCAMLTGGEYRVTVTPIPGARQSFAPAVGAHFDTIKVPKDGAVTGVVLAIKDERLAIHGIVVDDAGAPISDVHVAAIAPGESTMDPPSTLTDAAGRFEIENLARGTYRLDAHAADGSDGTQPGVAAGTTSASIKLTRAGAIDGTLIGFKSAATVFYWSATEGPGKSGRALVDGAKFSRVGVAPGRYTVEALAGADTDAVSVEVRAGETTHVDLHRRDVGAIEGTVLDIATRKPIAGMRCDAKVSANGETSPVPPDVPFQAFTDAAGHFKVSAPIGRVRIFCFSPSGGPVSPAGTDVDVASTEPAKVTVFGVRAGGPPSDAGFMVNPMLLPITVGDVVPNGPAATAGLRVGDQLVTIDGVSLQGVLPGGAMMLVANHRPGTVATLGILRGGAAQTVKVAVGGGPGQ
jgi:RNA polymerase sigma factor (sigma-70 family)